MSVAKFSQNNFTVDDATTYKGKLDGNISVLARRGAGFAPRAQDAPNMTVKVDAGPIWLGNVLSEVAAQNSPTITAPATNPRIDRIVIYLKTDSANSIVPGTLLFVQGTQAVSPVPPAIPDGCAPICQISLATSTTTITNSLITDERTPIGNAQTQIIPVAKTANYTSTLNDTGASISYANTSVLRVHTLPASSVISAGWWCSILSTTIAGVQILCQGSDVIVEGLGSPGSFYFAEGLARVTYLGGGIFQVDGVVQSGTLRTFPTSAVIPRGYFRRDGSAIVRLDYAALFGRIGTIWGAGNGTTTFNIPDIRGRVEIGDGQGSGLTNRTIAQVGGEEAHANTAAENGPHTHSETLADLSGVQTNGIAHAGYYGSGYSQNGGTTGSSGSGTAHNTMQPYAVYLKCIKY